MEIQRWTKNNIVLCMLIKKKNKKLGLARFLYYSKQYLWIYNWNSKKKLESDCLNHCLLYEMSLQRRFQCTKQSSYSNTYNESNEENLNDCISTNSCTKKKERSKMFHMLYDREMKKVSCDMICNMIISTLLLNALHFMKHSWNKVQWMTAKCIKNMYVYTNICIQYISFLFFSTFLKKNVYNIFLPYFFFKFLLDMC